MYIKQCCRWKIFTFILFILLLLLLLLFETRMVSLVILFIYRMKHVINAWSTILIKVFFILCEWTDAFFPIHPKQCVNISHHIKIKHYVPNEGGKNEQNSNQQLQWNENHIKINSSTEMISRIFSYRLFYTLIRNKSVAFDWMASAFDRWRWEKLINIPWKDINTSSVPNDSFIQSLYP